MQRRAPVLAAVLASITLAASTATAQAPRAPRVVHGNAEFAALRGVGDPSPHATQWLLYNDPLAGFSLAEHGAVDLRRRRFAVRSLALLRSRVRVLVARAIPHARRQAMPAQWRAMEVATVALVPLARRVSVARDPTLTTEALSALGYAFEHLGVERNRVNFYVPYHEFSTCGNMRVDDTTEWLIQQIRESPVPRPDLVAQLRQRVEAEQARRRREAAALEAERRRGPRPMDLESGSVGAERVLDVAMIYFAAAVHVSLTHGASAPSAWRALDRLQREDFAYRLEDALSHQRYVPNPPPWLAYGAPGATVPAGPPARPVTFAP